MIEDSFDETEHQIPLSDEEETSIDADAFKETSSFNIDLNVDLIESYYKRSKFVFDPEFQRRYVWDIKTKSRLIESLILNIPVPSILLANDEERNQYIVIDGKQRLNAIIEFMSPENEGKGFRLSGLEVLSSLHGCCYDDLKKNPAMARYCSSFENFVFKATIVKNYQNSLLYFVFARLNTNSVALSSQELRFALYPGEFSNFINKASIKNPQLNRILNLKKKECDPRMRDCELLCRYYAFKYFLGDYKTYVGDLLDTTYKKINSSWGEMRERVESDFEEFKNSVDFCYSIFSKNTFRPFSPSKNEYTAFNRLAYDLLVVFFSDPQHRETVNKYGKETFELFYKSLFSDHDFAFGFQPVTSEHDKTIARFEVFNARFKDKFVN